MIKDNTFHDHPALGIVTSVRKNQLPDAQRHQTQNVAVHGAPVFSADGSRSLMLWRLCPCSGDKHATPSELDVECKVFGSVYP